MSEALWRLVSSETRDLTPEFATEFSKLPASPVERDCAEKRLSHLKTVIHGGAAVAFNWATAKVLADGADYRVNGQHSSHVLAEMDGTMPAGLRVHIDHYEVPDKETLVLLFRQFDPRGSSRSVADIAGAYQGVQPDLVGVSKRAARAAVDGLTWFLGRIVGGYVGSGDDRFKLFSEAKYHPFIHMVGRVLSEKTPEFTRPVLGAMFGTWESSPTEAETFWTDVARQGSGNDEKHPTTVLDQWLLEGRESKEKPKEMEVYRACALAWNAHRNHRTLERIGRYDPKKGAPDLD